ncbi:MAG: phospho-N-acetylmuramoyl-pentapeptide-transferase [Alphaproteobacteria bacterium]|nr:phospho-N-acetylmuramoyl-pentapeptide-transferase [Alphaproteobacteria bacterium]
MFFWLSQFSADISVLNIFRYVTFRTGGAIITAFAIAVFFGPRFIRWLKSKQADGQPIRADGPQTHLAKKGTPTMGGLLLLVAIVVSSLLWAQWRNGYVWMLLFVLGGFGLAGFWDDYLKLTRRTSAGIPGKVKLGLQLAVSLVACSWIMYLTQGAGGTAATQAMSTSITIPFFKDLVLNLGYFYIPFVLVVMVGSSNAVNLTDGLDGLVSIPVITTTLVFMVIAYAVGRVDFAGYLQLYRVVGADELAVICGAMIGGTLGFLWYNAHPAQVFMGDTGSLALGGALGALSVATKQELVLAIAGGIFVMEALSDIIQVGSYKWRRKRVFLMAPIHHHFEKLGWSETTIVVRFWIVSIMLAIFALGTLKIR